MSSAARPTIKRTYGRPKPPPSSSPAPPSSSWADLNNDPRPTRSTSTSTLANRPSLARLIQPSSSSSFLRSSSPCPAPDTDDDPAPASTPPTSQKENVSRSIKPTSSSASPVKRPMARSSPANATAPPAKRPAPPTALPKAGTLLAFFKPADHNNKRQKLTPTSTSPEPSALKAHQPLLPARRAAKSATPSTPTKAKVKPSVGPKLEQLYLDPFEDAGHSMMSCSECSMSYARTPEDMAVHAKHHAKAVGGCDWLSGDGVGKGCTLVEDGIDWGNKGKNGKIVMVEGGAEGLTGRKLKDLLAVIDTSLSATSLTAEQLAESKAFVFVTPQRKVVACALVQRISQAYKVVPAPSAEQTTAASNVVSSPVAAQKPSAPLLKFDGDDDMGAIFCSPAPVPTLLGVHRIWTVPSHRCAGLASLLLDAVGARSIYGYPIARTRRGAEVAFSQPTGKGQALARRWTGGGELRVFVD